MVNTVFPEGVRAVHRMRSVVPDGPVGVFTAK